MLKWIMVVLMAFFCWRYTDLQSVSAVQSVISPLIFIVCLLLLIYKMVKQFRLSDSNHKTYSGGVDSSISSEHKSGGDNFFSGGDGGGAD